ncbi:MAG: ornithine carbamoyltransferase [Actinomycetota bacterium]|nr:ornithine carbamoyltransferase [Actinomycetota bacterium]
MTRLKGKDCLCLAEFTQDQIYKILAKGSEFKKLHWARRLPRLLEGKTVALIFEKPSTRTRVSFEAGVAQLGGHPLVLNTNDLQLKRGESIEDTGRVLSRYVDAIVMRTFSQDSLERLASTSDVPVVNALTDEYHPCQALADLLTILEKRDHLAGIKLAYIGDGNNVCHSLLLGGAMVGVDVWVATPKGFEPSIEVVKVAKGLARNFKQEIRVLNDPKVAAMMADVLYTDVWTSMGQEDEAIKRKRAFAPYQINEALLASAKKDALVMHCLPAHRGEEIEAAVLDGPHSVVFDQAENRLHVQKALLSLLIGDEK